MWAAVHALFMTYLHLLCLEYCILTPAASVQGQGSSRRGEGERCPPPKWVRDITKPYPL
jgi:hypothetical protein